MKEELLTLEQRAREVKKLKWKLARGILLVCLFYFGTLFLIAPQVFLLCEVYIVVDWLRVTVILSGVVLCSGRSGILGGAESYANL